MRVIQSCQFNLAQENSIASLLKSSLRALPITVMLCLGLGSLSGNAEESAEVIEEIVVTGIRGSLRAAAELKRNDDRIIDAVVAEDIGKLPDNNIAEALQRVTGVSINRDFGVGSEVSIRGLPQNRVEINGRSTMGDGRNGINFQDFPASFLSTVEVVKSPTPEMIEGALGGTISLKTARPLDLNEPLIAISTESEYADKADNWAPIINGQFGNTWELDGAGEFGVLGMLSYQDRRLRQDTYQTSLFVYDNIDINLDGVVDENDAAQNTPSGKYVVPVEPKIEPWTEERERTAANVILQWAPESLRGNFYLDLNVTERDGGQEAYSILSVGGGPVATAQTYEDANGALNNYRLEGHFAIPKTWTEFRTTESFTHALGGEWSFTDNLMVSGEYSSAESDSARPKSEFNWRAHNRAAEALNPSASNELVTNVTIINDSEKAPSVVYDDGEIYAQTSNYVLREFRHTDRFTTNTEDAFRIVVEYTEPFGLEWVSAVKAGFRTTEREFEYNEAAFRVKDIHRDMYDSDGNHTVVSMDEIITRYPDKIITPNVAGDMFEHSGILGTNQLAPFTVYDPKALQDTEGTYAMVQELLRGSNFNNPGNSDGYISPAGTLADNMNPTLSAYSLIGEDTEAFFVQANLNFERVRMVVGGRYVDTEITSTAYNDSGTELVSDVSSYRDFLPSFNAAVELSDQSTLRFSTAKVMRRPNFNELSPTFEFNSDFILASRGNPGLKPYRATQFDLAFEHYFGDANMLSVTLFYKDVESFLQSTNFCAYEPEALAQQNTAGIFGNTCIRPEPTGDSYTYIFSETQEEFDAFVAAGRNGILTTTVTNGQSGTVEGFEIGYQQTFDFLPGPWSGLGINANYTYSDSEDPDGVPLADISENSYNAQVYWEYRNFGLRLAYTFRDRFLDENAQKRVERVGALVANRDPTVADPTEGNDYRDDLQQLDFAANWDVTDHISVFGYIYNLTGEATINQAVTGTPWEIQESDRRYTVGVRARF